MIRKGKIAATSIVLGLMLSVAPALSAGSIEGTIKAKDLTKVVIYVAGVPGDYDGGATVMDQRNKLFVPYVLPVVMGTKVDFINSDELQHNVFGVGDDEFDLGNWTKGITREYVFEKPGEVVILCNVHPEMEAYVLVLDSPHFVRPSEEGTFRIADVPAGTYTIKAWYRGKVKKQRVTVPETGSVTVAF